MCDEYKDALARSMQLTKEAAAQQVFGSVQVKREGGRAVFDTSMLHTAPLAIKQVDPNSMPALSMPLKDLVTLWQAKFGDRWVPESDVDSDQFWSKGAQRLINSRLLEQWSGHLKIKEL